MIYGREKPYGENVLANPLNGLKCILGSPHCGWRKGRFTEIYIGLTGKEKQEEAAMIFNLYLLFAMWCNSSPLLIYISWINSLLFTHSCFCASKVLGTLFKKKKKSKVQSDIWEIYLYIRRNAYLFIPFVEGIHFK